MDSPFPLFFQQYYLECLSHASYLVGDLSTGRAVVIDPQRDVADYVSDARANGLNIELVIETHFHADFLSGHLELAAQTGASIAYGARAEGRADFSIITLKDREHVSLGDVDLEIRETPGHTPESICVVVRARATDDIPYGVLTGDTLFIGDVGRPDLLASVGVSATDLARELYDSLHGKLLVLPDDTKVFPAHGAGSACGKNLSTETVSTIGEQRRTNYALQSMSVDDFVDAVTRDQAIAPLYFSFAANRNRESRDLYSETDDTHFLDLANVLEAARNGAVIVDSRDDVSFALGHLRGSINVGMDGRFAEYVGEVIEPGTAIVIVAPDGRENEARTRLARIGFDNVVGALRNPRLAMLQNPDLVERQSRLSVNQLAERIASVKDISLIDVRNAGEVALGTIPGARHISLPALLRSVNQLDPSLPTIVFCAGGYRSSIASSLLKAHGFSDVSDLIGGYSAWVSGNIPTNLPTIDVADVHLDGSITLLDVREDDEWKSAHLDGAVHIPMNQLVERLGEIDSSRQIVVMCRSGQRSARVTAWLVNNGHDARNMTGGIIAWSEAGRPTVAD